MNIGRSCTSTYPNWVRWWRPVTRICASRRSTATSVRGLRRRPNWCRSAPTKLRAIKWRVSSAALRPSWTCCRWLPQPQKEASPPPMTLSPFSSLSSSRCDQSCVYCIDHYCSIFLHTFKVISGYLRLTFWFLVIEVQSYLFIGQDIVNNLVFL